MILIILAKSRMQASYRHQSSIQQLSDVEQVIIDTGDDQTLRDATSFRRHKNQSFPPRRPSLPAGPFHSAFLNHDGRRRRLLQCSRRADALPSPPHGRITSRVVQSSSKYRRR